MTITPQNVLSSPICVVRGIPGSGKSNLAIDTAIEAYRNKQRVVLVTTSNAQSFDLCRRISHRARNARVLLYHRTDLDIPSILHSEGVEMATGSSLFEHGPCIVLGNAAKWAWIKPPIPFFDLMIIDDASSIRESLFMQISGLAKRYLIIHDQTPLSPIIKSNTQRWEHMSIAPHHSIIDTIKKHDPKIHTLDHTNRLPQDTVDILYPDVFPHKVTATSQERRLVIPHPNTSLWKQVTQGASLVQALFPSHTNEEIALWVAQNIKDLLAQKNTIHDTRMKGRLSPAKIAIVCAEHTQVLLMEKALGTLSKEILIDIQLHQRSIERAIVFSFHPLNQMIHPSPYNWDPARLSLCVTRHRVACILLSTSTHYRRPITYRNLYQEQNDILFGYHAHTTLQKKLIHRTHTQTNSIGIC
ncbi:MAG: hypothetical protein CL916_00590 [Deltaproteobacteria bacterium]|nr:hypothetical protein [Deltaproteobacteria bacterium]